MVAVFTDSKQPFFLSPKIPETQANGAHYSRWLLRFLKVGVAARRTGKPMMKIRHGNAMKRLIHYRHMFGKNFAIRSRVLQKVFCSSSGSSSLTLYFALGHPWSIYF